MRHRLLFLVCVILLGSCGESKIGSRMSLVETQDGPVQGREDGELYTYFGIPYAAPPIGPLRWKPPQPAAPWTDGLETTGPQAPIIEAAPAIIPVPKCPQSLTAASLQLHFSGRLMRTVSIST